MIIAEPSTRFFYTFMFLYRHFRPAPSLLTIRLLTTCLCRRRLEERSAGIVERQVAKELKRRAVLICSWVRCGLVNAHNAADVLAFEARTRTLKCHRHWMNHAADEHTAVTRPRLKRARLCLLLSSPQGRGRPKSSSLVAAIVAAAEVYNVHLKRFRALPRRAQRAALAKPLPRPPVRMGVAAGAAPGDAWRAALVEFEGAVARALDEAGEWNAANSEAELLRPDAQDSERGADLGASAASGPLGWASRRLDRVSRGAIEALICLWAAVLVGAAVLLRALGAVASGG